MVQKGTRTVGRTRACPVFELAKLINDSFIIADSGAAHCGDVL
jgi:hypothetical protein